MIIIHMMCEYYTSSFSDPSFYPLHTNTLAHWALSFSLLNLTKFPPPNGEVRVFLHVIVIKGLIPSYIDQIVIKSVIRPYVHRNRDRRGTQ